MQNHHIERHEKPAVANSIAKYTRLCKGREERFFLLRNAKLKRKPLPRKNLERGMPLRTISTFVAKGKEPLQPDH